MLGSATRQIQVYGRKGRTRVVDDVHSASESPTSSKAPAAPATPPRATRGLLASVDLRGTFGAWMQSPRDAFSRQIATPLRGLTGWGAVPRSENESEDADANALESPSKARSMRAPERRAMGEIDVNASTQAIAALSLEDSDAGAARRCPSTSPPRSPLSAASAAEAQPPTAHAVPLEALLKRTQQSAPADFTALINDMAGATPLTKIGEASYSEVYRLVQRRGPRTMVSVIKIIPLAEDDADDARAGPALSPVASVEREVAVSAALSHATRADAARFVRLQSAHVAQGVYPAPLLAAWDAYKAAHVRESENARPDALPPKQLFALLVMDDAGSELERTPLATWMERAAEFWQTACAVATAERTLELEHRDLHRGNILVRRTQPRRATRSVSGSAASVPSPATPVDALARRYAPAATQIEATIIDYSLSRMRLDGCVVAYDFRDEELFAGRGDTQYDVYRTMRTLVAGDWAGHHPVTNVLVRTMWRQTDAVVAVCGAAPLGDWHSAG